ncbi:GntR family transcriptional regulator [Microbacterium rhizomatis]|uniref:GntR family transcriptional regulator n=1 Tax=Microbacterium rhizomatis TaxID=1631477 RepID=A0A5J5IYW1_9MICO|nr:GntR family transcriptional regulator [Microbacterium rhizomatis]KAA9107516.1 GntR family transcriptional regulator [Microbacterium rhizomatis]
MFTYDRYSMTDSSRDVRWARVADQVHDALLEAIVEGKLIAGQSIDHREWAERLGVSRTPVREAILRLEAFGLVDVEAACFTRVTSFTPEAAARELRDWRVMQQAVISTLNPAVLPELLCQLREAIAAISKSLDDVQQRAAADFAYFALLRAASDSLSLRLGATAAAYRLRLALPNSPVDTELHEAIAAALEGGAPSAATTVLGGWPALRASEAAHLSDAA